MAPKRKMESEKFKKEVTLYLRRKTMRKKKEVQKKIYERKKQKSTPIGYIEQICFELPNLRKLYGWCQTDLAKRVGVSQPTITFIENNNQNKTKKMKSFILSLFTCICYELKKRQDITESIDSYVNKGVSYTIGVLKDIGIPNYRIRTIKDRFEYYSGKVSEEYNKKQFSKNIKEYLEKYIKKLEKETYEFFRLDGKMDVIKFIDYIEKDEKKEESKVV